MSFDFDGKVLNPYGVEIDLPFWVFKRLKKLHLLERDAATGMRRIQARVFGLMDLWDGPDFRPDRRFRAFDPGYQNACSKDSGYSRGYGSKWRDARKHFLDQNPLCVECNRMGRLTAATIVDHIIPHKGDPGIFWNQSNRQALCRRCHNRKTAMSNGRWA